MAQIITQTLSYTGSSQTLAIPSCVSQVSISCYGAKGANGVGTASGAIGGTAGLGAMASGVYTLMSSGITLNVNVGGAGTGSVGGFNGGGAGNRGPSGAGGGASDIRVGGTGLANRIIVAGGGGGGGNAGCASSTLKGGNGGSGGGGNGASGVNSVAGGGGQGGNGTSGGAAGIGCSFASGTVGASGTSGQGGNGGGGPNVCGAFVSGGGGGGGYFGGGAGGGGSAGTTSCTLNDQGGGGGGAGGTNYFSAAFTNTSVSAGVNNGNGYVVISYSIDPSPTISVNSGSVCSGNSFVITPSGATSYTITGGQFTVTPAVTSSYTITGDVSGCPASNTIVSGVSVFITPTIAVNSGSICSGSVFTITPSGASSYTIQGGSATVSPFTNSTYTVTGMSSDGCPGNTVTCVVNVTLTPVVTAATTQTLTCTITTVTLNGTGASTYTWTGPSVLSGANSANAVVTSGGTYSLTGSSNGCTSSVTTVAVSTNTVKPILSVVPASTAMCEGNTATLTVGGATSYTWSTTSQATSISVSPTLTSSYTVTGTNSAGCTNTAVVNVSVNPTPVLLISGGNTAVCAGSSATLTASGASSYLWNTSASLAAISITPATTSTYSVSGTSAFGCTASAVTGVTVNPIPSVSISASSSSICSGSSTSLTASGAAFYLWSNSATTSVIDVSPGSTTNYSVTGTSAEGCTAIAVADITVNIQPTVSISASSFTICEGNPLSLMAGGAISYSWSTNSTQPVISVTPSITTIYSVTGSSPEGCTDSTFVTITVHANPTVSIAADKTVTCSGETVQMSASGAQFYAWTTGANTNTLVVQPTSTTSYSVTGFSAQGCTAAAVQSVSVNALPVVTTSASSDFICAGQTVTITAYGADSYSWSTASVAADIVVTPSFTTTYTVVGTSTVTSCQATAFITQTVSECTSLLNRKIELKISLFPNPNNGEFSVEADTNAELTITDLFGQLLYSEKHLAGKSELHLAGLQNGVYVLTLKTEGKSYQQKFIKD